MMEVCSTYRGGMKFTALNHTTLKGTGLIGKFDVDEGLI
jgi:hypothetical protein